MKRAELRTKIEVMQKGVFVVTNIYKGGIQTGYYFFHSTQVYITDLKLASLLFLMEFYERLVFKEGYTTSVLSGTNN